MRTKLIPIAIPAVFALAACREAASPVACTLPVHFPSTFVTAQDSISGANITPGATFVLSNATYEHSVVGQPWMTGISVGEGYTGTFTLNVSQTGYQPWTKVVTVEKEACGARTLQVLARLKPA